MSSIDYDINMGTSLQPQILIAKNDNTNRAVKINDDGMKLEYDINSVIKTFEISHSGINWGDGTNNYNTTLERLSLVQTALSAVEIPPNATSLKINNSLIITDGVNTNTITSIPVIRYYQNTLPFSVSGTPINVIFASPVITAMTANTIWKVDVALYSSSVAARNLNTYVVADTLNAKVETNSVFGYTGGGFQTALPPNVPSPIGSYIKYTDTFEVDASAIGSCRFYYTGGTSDGSTWSGNCNLSIVLTRLS